MKQGNCLCPPGSPSPLEVEVAVFCFWCFALTADRTEHTRALGVTRSRAGLIAPQTAGPPLPRPRQSVPFVARGGADVENLNNKRGAAHGGNRSEMLGSFPVFVTPTTAGDGDLRHGAAGGLLPRPLSQHVSSSSLPRSPPFGIFTR